jgi:ribosome-binding factor A
MSTFRKERMGEAIRQVVSAKLIRHASLLPGGMLTVNRVDVSPDYTVAKIFFSAFGSEMGEEQLSKLMKEYQNEFRYEVSQKLNLRRTPKLMFCFDKNTEYASKIDSLLK